MSALNQSRCTLCPTNPDGRYCNRPVPPSGPQPARVLFIGAGPFKGENNSGVPYTGLAGDEFTNTYLPLANLHRDDVAITYASQCWDGSDRTPSEKRILTCARHHLPSLLDRVQPEIVALMGGVTQRLCDKRLRLDVHHGIPQRTSILGGMWEGWVWPMYEPALGMRDTGMMSPLMEDFRRLGKWMRGEWAPPVLVECPVDYRYVETVRGFDDYLNERPVIRKMALDAEDHGPEVWSFQISHTPHTGRLIRTNNLPVMRALAAYAREQAKGVTWLLHQATGDQDRAHKCGVELVKWQDTMEEAYHLCSLPQGLKALVYRLFGVEMRSWEDTVWPASADAWVDWCEDALALAAAQPEALVTELKRGHCKRCGHYHSKGVCKCGCPVMDLTRIKVEYRPSALESVLRHLHRYTVQTRDDDEPYNPWKELPAKRAAGLRGRVADAVTWNWLEEMVGKPPVLGIGNCDAQEALMYACGDADWTLQLAERLEEERGGERWRVDAGDYDV